jgi:hypothetical protein
VQIRNARNRQFYDYWQSLDREVGTVIPKRSAFRPEDIPSLLPNIIIYELVSRENIKIRLQGTAINDRFGHDMTGVIILIMSKTAARKLRLMLFG